MLIDGDSRCYSVNDLEVFNLLKHPVWIFDIERRCMYWGNKSALEVWNADSVTALTSRDFASDMSDAAKARLKELHDKIKRNEIVYEQWTYYPQGRGATTLVSALSAIRIEGGRIALLNEAEPLEKASCQDTSVREIEILRHVPFAVSQFSMEGEVIYQNPEAFNLFDKATLPHIKCPQQTAFLNRFVDVGTGISALKQVQAGKEYSAEVEQYTELGPRWFSVALRRTKDPLTSENRILHSARDISELISARQETNRAALKTEFMAVMAHEIRTPLHQMVGYLDLFAQAQFSPDQMQSLYQIQSSASLLMSIINDLLDYSKLECGQLKVETIPFPLLPLLNGCLAAVKPSSDQKQLNLKCNISDEFPSLVVGDPNRLRQILLNLLSNAVKFTAHGFVHLNATRCSNDGSDIIRVRFEVIDSGIGIDPSQQEIVFEKYQQANLSVTRQYGGTGLGLAICQGLTELMGGLIGVKSDLGKGTTMFVEIPFQVSKSDIAEKEIPRACLEPDILSSALRILVVEDNKINQKLALAMLRKMGHSAVVAENGQVALDVLQQTLFDVVLMDLQMPVMDGIECTKYIRKQMHLDKETLPIIGLTASFQNSDIEFYESIGMNSCVGKPLRMDYLKKILKIEVDKLRD